MKKPFSETKIGIFLKEKVKPIAGDALKIVGDLTGIQAIEKVGDFLNSKKEDSVEMMALHLEFEKLRTEFELEMTRIEAETYKAELEDVQDARSREIQFMQANGGKRDWIQGGLVISTMLLVFASLFYLAFYEIPKSNERVFDMILGGVIVAGSQNIYAYFFGSSKGSRIKDEIIKSKVK